MSDEKEEQLLKDLAAMSEFSRHNQDAQDRLDSAIAKLVAFKPIFGTVFMFLNKQQNRAIPTMGVGVIRRVDLALAYNPEWILSLTSNELRAVLQHEALHVLLHHIARIDYFSYNRKLYNIAADMAINCHIANLPGKCFYPETYQLPNFESSEWYYEKIKKEAEKESKNCPGGAPGGEDFGKGKGDLVDSHEGWGECEDDIVKEKIQNVANACIKAQEEKGWSDIGSGLAKAIIEANKPTINWKREVRWFINRMVQSGREFTRTRLNRREQSTKKFRSDDLKDVYIQPGSKKTYTSKLLVGIDSSGSVSDAEIQAFIGEVNGMCTHVECHVVFWDTQIQGTPVPIKKKVQSLEVRGRGGTDVTPILRYVDEHHYDGLIIFSDGFFPCPQPPPRCRVLWCISPGGDSVEFPYGKKIRVEIKKK